MAGVLITGFEPFGGEAVNPSWEVVKRLDGAIIAGQPVVARQLPCVFGDALTALNAALDDQSDRDRPAEQRHSGVGVADGGDVCL